jgi:hypothetical protein
MALMAIAADAAAASDAAAVAGDGVRGIVLMLLRRLLLWQLLLKRYVDRGPWDGSGPVRSSARVHLRQLVIMNS